MAVDLTGRHVSYSIANGSLAVNLTWGDCPRARCSARIWGSVETSSGTRSGPQRSRQFSCRSASSRRERGRSVAALAARSRMGGGRLPDLIRSGTRRRPGTQQRLPSAQDTGRRTTSATTAFGISPGGAISRPGASGPDQVRNPVPPPDVHGGAPAGPHRHAGKEALSGRSCSS